MLLLTFRYSESRIQNKQIERERKNERERERECARKKGQDEQIAVVVPGVVRRRRQRADPADPEVRNGVPERAHL